MPTSAITASSSGDNTVVAAQAGYAIRVLGYVLTFSAAVNAKWKSGSSTDLTGLLYGIGTGPLPVVVPECGKVQRGWFQTAAGQALVLNLSGGVAVGGHVIYETTGQ